MSKTAFHVHTYRCGHAENIPDECYVKKALDLGIEDIWFTDHAPFPDNPFGHRMSYEQLDEYIRTLSALKKQYHSKINIHIGLETEYFLSYDKAGYYQQLHSMPELEMLLLGQHMAEMSPLKYSFSETEEYLSKNEHRLLGNAMIQGIKTGYFNAVAHPDRIFRRCTVWNTEMENSALEIINTAVLADIPLEMNLSSLENPKNYKKEFWQLVPDTAGRIVGLDAHFLCEMETRYTHLKERIELFYQPTEK